MLVLLGTVLYAHGQQLEVPVSAQVGFPWDWSDQHVVFTNTTDLQVLEKIGKDPRLFHRRLRSNLPVFEQNSTGNFGTYSFAVSAGDAQDTLAPKPRRMKKDWNTDLGNGGFVIANTFPAKWTFNVNGTPSCTLDYVVFPTGADGTLFQASIVAFNQLYSTQGSRGGLCAQNGPSVDWAYVNAPCPLPISLDPIKSSPVLSLDGTKVAWVTTTGKV
jgi:hypothetical protein